MLAEAFFYDYYLLFNVESTTWSRRATKRRLFLPSDCEIGSQTNEPIEYEMMSSANLTIFTVRV